VVNGNHRLNLVLGWVWFFNFTGALPGVINARHGATAAEKQGRQRKYREGQCAVL